MIIEFENPRMSLEEAVRQFWKDDSLSWQAKWLMVYLLYSQKEKCRVGLPELMAASKDGEKATRNIVNELIACGRIIRSQKRENVRFLEARHVFSVLPGKSMEGDGDPPRAACRHAERGDAVPPYSDSSSLKKRDENPYESDDSDCPSGHSGKIGKKPTKSRLYAIWIESGKSDKEYRRRTDILPDLSADDLYTASRTPALRNRRTPPGHLRARVKLV